MRQLSGWRVAESIEGMRLCYGTASGRLASDVVDSGNHSPEFLSRAKTEYLLRWSLHGRKRSSG